MSLKLNYPRKLKSISNFRNSLYPLNNTLYKILKADASTCGNCPINYTPFEYQKNEFYFTDITNNLTFNYNNITYKNNSVINNQNMFLKFAGDTTFTDVNNSIKSMFENNGVLDDYNYTDLTNANLLDINYIDTTPYTINGIGWTNINNFITGYKITGITDNAKIYQQINLNPGSYRFEINFNINNITNNGSMILNIGFTNTINTVAPQLSFPTAPLSNGPNNWIVNFTTSIPYQYFQLTLEGTDTNYEMTINNKDIKLYSNNQYFKFALTAKDKGFKTFSTNYLLTYSSFDKDYYTNNLNTPNHYITNNIVISENIVQDVENYEQDIDIFKYNYNTLSYDKLTTLNRKENSLCDFNISNILKLNVEDWKPILNDYNINVNKGIEKFKLEAYQKFVDKNIDKNNIYVNNFGDKIIDELYVIDAKDELFENYNNTLYDKILNNNTSGSTLDKFLDSYAQINLDLLGTTSGHILYNYIDQDTFRVNNIYYNKLLTNQPQYKILNNNYEILSNQASNLDFILNDKVQFKFYLENSSSSTIEIIELNTTASIINERYINQLSFYVPNLKNKIIGNWDEVVKFEVKFLSYYLTTVQHTATTNSFLHRELIESDVQTYYIDKTIQICDDTTQLTSINCPIVFKNRKGAYDIFEFDSIQEVKSDRNIKTYTSPFDFRFNSLSEFEKIYNLELKINYLVKSRILTDEEFIWLKDLVVSEKVYIYINNNLYPIIINDMDYNTKLSDDKIITFSFNYSRPENI